MPKGWRSLVAACVSGGLAMSIAACGSSSGSNASAAAAAGGGASSTASSTASTASSGGSSGGACGTTAYVKPQDPDGVLAKMPAATKQSFNGYAYPVYASKWATWKPSGKNLTIAMDWTQPTNDFAAQTLQTVESSLRATPGVSKVTVQAGAGVTDIPAQVQQYQSLLQQKPTMILLSASAGQPFVSLVKKAAAEGIPTLSVLTNVNSPDAVTVVPNTYLAAVQTAESVVKSIGGKGNALIVQGIPGLSINTDALNGIKAVLANCPNIKTAGTVTGMFQPSVAKAQVLSFLGTHPQGVDAAFASGGVGSGILSAFSSTGRKAPAVTEQAVTKATLGYWLAHKSGFTAAATGGGAAAFGQLVSMVAKDMLAGNGIKISSVLQPQPLVTNANVSQWGQSGWTLSTPGTAVDPAGTYNNAALVKPLFNK